MEEYKYYHRVEECSVKMLLVVEIFVEITRWRKERRGDANVFNKERGNFVTLIRCTTRSNVNCSNTKNSCCVKFAKRGYGTNIELACGSVS